MRAATRSARVVMVVLLAAAAIVVQAAAQTPAAPSATVSDKDLASAINALGAFDFPARLAASRTVRRATPAHVVPALTAAAQSHADSYVQYRALVLLAGFDDSSTPQVMQSLMASRNDRLRAVAYAWFGHHPSPAMVPALIDALSREMSAFLTSSSSLRRRMLLPV